MLHVLTTAQVPDGSCNNPQGSTGVEPYTTLDCTVVYVLLWHVTTSAVLALIHLLGHIVGSLFVFSSVLFFQDSVQFGYDSKPGVMFTHTCTYVYIYSSMFWG